MATKAPSPGFDVRFDTRIMPDGSVPPPPMQLGKRHEIVVSVPGNEEPGATTPETAKATGGLGLPKLGEKFSASAATGAGSVSVVFPLPPGRGLTPGLGIGYSTNAGNGPFGWRWRLSVPYFIRASTRALLTHHGRGIPIYDDANDSDVFIFSDAEELVKDPSGNKNLYRARVEGGFAEIKRVAQGGVSHWVVRSPDNVTSIFGRDPEAQIVDPEDQKRVFQWLLQEQRDDQGNVVIYRYKKENTDGVTGAESQRLLESQEGTQRYLKRVLYSNRKKIAEGVAPGKVNPEDFMFEIVLDYGEHNEGAKAGVDDGGTWKARRDPFSMVRGGFEVRTRRLCRRVLVFHRFRALNAAKGADPKTGSLDPVLVSSTDLAYEEDPFGSRLVKVTQRGFDQKAGTEGTMPPREFTYTKRSVRPKTRKIPASTLFGFDTKQRFFDAEFFDLDGVGVAGLLTRENGSFVFRRAGTEPGTYAKPEKIPFGASPENDPAVHLQRFLDINTTGQPALVEFGANGATVFERVDGTRKWKNGVKIPSGKTPPVVPKKETDQQRVYIVDLDGDGDADVLVATPNQYTWWRRQGPESKDGWEQQAPPIKHESEDDGPAPVLYNQKRDQPPKELQERGLENPEEKEAIVFADMTGDGLADVVRLRANEVAYWPNLGNGKFGRKVMMDAPGMGEEVKSRRVRLLDVDGTGTTDILYLGKRGATLWMNESGNRLRGVPLGGVPSLATQEEFKKLKLSSLTRLDGRTTGSFAFASGESDGSIQVIDLADEHPFLITQDKNNMGLQTQVSYRLSSAFFLADEANKRPWRTRLPIVVPLVEKVVAQDLVAGTRFTSRYVYHHGHYDTAERAFAGFGMVEQIDSESFSELGGSESSFQTKRAEHFVAPTRSKTWFHLGRPDPDGTLSREFATEYFQGDPQAMLLPDAPTEPASLPEPQKREAARALRGSVLRTEVYEDHDPDQLDLSRPENRQKTRPFTVSETAYKVKRLFAPPGDRHGCMFPFAQQTLTYTYERQEEADPRLSQSAVLEVDEFGNATKTVAVAYPRRKAVPEPPVSPRKDDPKPHPDVVQARVTGFMFDEAKNFIRPEARNGIRALAKLYEQHPGFHLLIVGHTDREGKVAYNDVLSLERAESVAAFLRDDVEVWLARYDNSVSSTKRWGDDENRYMLEALGFGLDKSQIRAFQEQAGIEPIGKIGPKTRRALITQYMAMDGTSLPAGTPVTIVGAGEHFPAVFTKDGVEQPQNRRTELFLFKDTIDPPPPGANLKVDSPQYTQWVSTVGKQFDVTADNPQPIDPDGPSPGPIREDDIDPALARSDAPKDDAQLRTHIVVSETKVANQTESDVYRIGTPFEASSYEVTGSVAKGDPTSPFTVDKLKSLASGGTVIPFEQKPDGSKHERRLLSKSRNFFYQDSLDEKEPLPLGEVGLRALPFESRTMALSVAQARALFDDQFKGLVDSTDHMMKTEGRYIQEDDAWWTRGPRAIFDAEKFYLPVAVKDVFATKADKFLLPDASSKTILQTTQTTEYDDDQYLVVATNDVLIRQEPSGDVDLAPRNRTDILPDYRVLAPAASNDPNNTTVCNQYDALGMVIATVVRGSDEPFDPQNPFGDDPFTAGKEGDDRENPARRSEHDLFAFMEHQRPVSARSFMKIDRGTKDIRYSLGVTYFGGAGQVVQEKVRDDDGKFRTSGRTIINNKGLPVFSFQPFVSSSDKFDPGGSKRTATMRYDALGRLVRTDYPDGTLERVVFDAWQSQSFDRNDTVLESDWFKERIGLGANDPKRQAAEATRHHANTPVLSRFDSLGRPTVTFARYHDEHDQERVIATRQVLDIQGNVLDVIDARGNVAEKREYGMLGQALRVVSVDAGEHRAIADAQGKPLRARDGKGRLFRWTFDELNRPVADFVYRFDYGHEKVLVMRVYGDGKNEETKAKAKRAPQKGRRRGRLLRVYDGAGELTFTAYDMEGNPTAVERRMTNFVAVLEDTKTKLGTPQPRPDWAVLLGLDNVQEIDAFLDGEKILEDDAFLQTMEYDARGRVKKMSSNSGGFTHQMRYTEDGLLDRVQRLDKGQFDTVYRVPEYDELARPVRVEHGDAAVCRYSYDELTERLESIKTTKQSGGRLQDLNYTYDPVGNITQVRDAAQETIHFAGARIEPVNTYHYDALYRLVAATGREHEGQAGGRSHEQAVVQRVTSPNDPKAMRHYRQQYHYDDVGNITELVHQAGAGSFRRHYQYSAFGNRLRATGRKPDALIERYEYDILGNMVKMPHLDRMAFGDTNRLERTERGTQTVYFQYDASGKRVRKFVDKGNGTIEERIYLGSEERFQLRRGPGFKEVVQETITEHAAGGALRIERKTIKDGKIISKPKELFRHQLSNHLGSVALELNEDGKVISYEEYHPYGTTSYRATNSQVEVSPNRYRYTGMERDDETGLSLHGARYYAPWLGRWTAADPIGLGDGVNRYAYVRGNPISHRDSTGTSTDDDALLQEITGSQVAAALHDMLVRGMAGEDITPEAVQLERLNIDAEEAEGRSRFESAVLRVSQDASAMNELAQSGNFSEHELWNIRQEAATLYVQQKLLEDEQRDNMLVIGRYGQTTSAYAKKRAWAEIYNRGAHGITANIGGTAAYALSTRITADLEKQSYAAAFGATLFDVVTAFSLARYNRYEPTIETNAGWAGLVMPPKKTPGGRTLTDHARDQMLEPPRGRVPMKAAEVDNVLDTADKVRKISKHPKGNTITIQKTTLPGKPQVVVDVETGQRVVTVIKNRPK